MTFCPHSRAGDCILSSIKTVIEITKISNFGQLAISRGTNNLCPCRRRRSWPARTRACWRRAQGHAQRTADGKNASDAPMSGHRRGCFPARDRIVSQAMMGGGAFTPLKTGRTGPENVKQAEMPVADLRKVLCTAGSLGRVTRS